MISIREKNANAKLLIVKGKSEQNFLNKFKREYNLNYKIIIEITGQFKSLDELITIIMSKYNFTSDDDVYVIRDIEYSEVWLSRLTIYRDGKYFPKQNVFVSNPCLEIYFLSLFQKVGNKYYNLSELKRRLSKNLNCKYSKSKGLEFDISNCLSAECINNIKSDFLKNQNTNFSNLNSLLNILVKHK